jgi:hypothetical protein
MMGKRKKKLVKKLKVALQHAACRMTEEEAGVKVALVIPTINFYSNIRRGAIAKLSIVTHHTRGYRVNRGVKFIPEFNSLAVQLDRVEPRGALAILITPENYVLTATKARTRKIIKKLKSM